MLGKAPTRITVCPNDKWAIKNKRPTNTMNRLPIPAPCRSAVNHHGQNTWLVFFAKVLLGSWGFGILDDVGERGVLEDFRGGVAYVQKYLVKRPVFGVAIDETAQLFGVAERS